MGGFFTAYKDADVLERVKKKGDFMLRKLQHLDLSKNILDTYFFVNYSLIDS